MRRITSARVASFGCLGAITIALPSAAGGSSDHPIRSFRPDGPAAALELPSQVSTEYATGREVFTHWMEVWKPMCGSRGAVSTADLTAVASAHGADFADPSLVTTVDTPQDGLAATLNIVFSLGASVPAAAVPAFAIAEQYLESQYTDPITVTITVSYAALGTGVLGATTPVYTSTTYTAGRAGIVAGADPSDTLQARLPTGSSIGVRYSGNSSTITAENKVYFTRANYKATIGTATGNDASMQFSTAVTWDYDPTNGVTGYSFADVVVHEVSHAMGFISAIGLWSKESSSLDLFRFQTTDGTADYNPDTNAEFTARPRLVSSNSPNDAHHTDMVGVEYRLSDGNPYQAAHLREESPTIGIMDPVMSTGVTRYPNFFMTSDRELLDLIGWDHVDME